MLRKNKFNVVLKNYDQFLFKNGEKVMFIKSKWSKLIVILILPILLIASFDDAQAAREKKSKKVTTRTTKYNPKATRAQAIEIIKNNSATVSELAGLEANVEKCNNDWLKNDGEDLYEGEIIGDYGEDIAELEKEDDITVNIDDFKTLWMQFVTGEFDKTSYGLKKSDLMDKIMEWLGTPYRFGGNTEHAIDCSGWTQRIFMDVAGILLPRTAREQVNIGQKVNRKSLEFGDLVFFHTYSRKFASHVGIYLGDNLFAHASSRFGVTVSSLESQFYKNRFIGGRRLSQIDIQRLAVNKPKTAQLQ